MKKHIALIVALITVLTALSACGKKQENNPQTDNVTVRLGGLKGPTSMGMCKLIDDAGKNLTENAYTFKMAAAADELTPAFLRGELDIIAVPANLGAILYNNSEGRAKALAINTLGVVYIVEKGGNTVNSIADLKGKTIYATGKGTTPEYALNYLLSQSSLTEADVKTEWKSEPTEVVAQLRLEESAVAMIPQPFVTVAMSQVEGLRTALSLTSVWDSLGNGSRFVTAVLLVRSEFADEHPDAVKKFLEEYRASSDWVNANPKDASVLIEGLGIVKAAIAEKAIPGCNIVCISGADMKSSLSGYLNTLFTQNAKSVGGKLPADDFYLIYD